MSRFRASPRSLQPVYTTGPVQITRDGKYIITCLGDEGEEALISEVDGGLAVARIKGVSIVGPCICEHVTLTPGYTGWNSDHCSSRLLSYISPNSTHGSSISVNPLLSSPRPLFPPHNTLFHQCRSCAVPQVLSPAHKSSNSPIAHHLPLDIPSHPLNHLPSRTRLRRRPRRFHQQLFGV